MKAHQIIGKKYGRLTVIKQISKSKYLCKCECGNEKSILKASLLSGRTRSCGCLRSEIVSEKNIKNATHRETKSRLYHIWRNMKARCYYKKQPEYENYGGRGITVCEEWRKSYETFRDWALLNGYGQKLTLDRKDTNGNYEPKNCRWVTYKEQENNKRNNRICAYSGKLYTLTELSEKIGINISTLAYRINKGWSENDLSLPPKTNNKEY